MSDPSKPLNRFGLAWTLFRVLGYFLGFTVFAGVIHLVASFVSFPSTSDVLPAAWIRFLKWPFYAALIYGWAFPMAKLLYGIIAEDISNRAVIKMRYAAADQSYAERLYQETDSMNWKLGAADILFPGNIE